MANLVRHQELDAAILHAITGSDTPFGTHIVIEDDYLLRERMENLREGGFAVPEDFQPREKCAYEVRDYKGRKWMEELEDKRTARLMEWDQFDTTPDDDYVPEPALEVVVVI
jgi:hypothetical protein